MISQKVYVRWVLVILIFMIAVVLVGVAWHYENNKEDININKQSTECEEKGGNFVKGSAEYGVRCIMPYTDAGQVCYSSDECEGDCVTNILSQLGIEGVCENNTDNQGCYAAIEDDEILCTFDDIVMGCSEDSWGNYCYKNVKKTTKSVLCYEITTEDECDQYKQCIGSYGSSYCDDNGICTTDLAYNGCIRYWQRDNCLDTGGSWIMPSDSVKFVDEGKCLCFDDKELDEFYRCNSLSGL